MFHAILSLALLAGAADATSDVAEPAPLDQDVAKAARYYRIQVYHTYRMQRGEYNRRRDLGNQVVEDWKEAGQPEGNRDAVLQWFQQARQAAFAGGNAPQAPSMNPFVESSTPEKEFAVVEPPAVTPPVAPVLTPAAPPVTSVVEPLETNVSTPELPGPPPALPALPPLGPLDEQPSPLKKAPVEDAKESTTKKSEAETKGADALKPLDALPPLPAPAAPWNGVSEPKFNPTAPTPGAGSSSR